MAGIIVAPQTVLSDSTFKTRPNSFIFFRSDANAGLNSAQANRREWLERQVKFPNLSGRKDVESFQNLQNLQNPSFIKWNNEGDFRPHAPRTSLQNCIDPINGFVSVGWDAENSNGYTQSHSYKRFNDTPQSYNPRQYHSIRLNCHSAPLETRRASENDAGTPSRWNSKLLSDREIRAELTGIKVV